MDLGLRGRVALVAGGTSGLGLGVAQALAAEGCAVSVCGRSTERLTATEDSLRALGATAVLARAVDVSDDDLVRSWVDETVRELGGLHVVVTNSGGPPPGAVDTFDVAAHRAAYDSAVAPHIGLALAAAPHLRAGGWGRILLVASETVRQPIPKYGLSSTVRPALLGFARTMAQQLGPSGVTINVLAPGYHDTPGLRRQFASEQEADAALANTGAGIPVGRVGRPADFGAVAAFLASEQAGFVTGTTLLVDGGATRGI